jgi:hypothetical protein
MGDDLISVRFQEIFFSFSALQLGYGVIYKTENKENNIYKCMGATYGSSKELLQKMPIYRATKNFITLQILQPVGII